VDGISNSELEWSTNVSGKVTVAIIIRALTMVDPRWLHSYYGPIYIYLQGKKTGKGFINTKMQ